MNKKSLSLILILFISVFILINSNGVKCNTFGWTGNTPVTGSSGGIVLAEGIVYNGTTGDTLKTFTVNVCSEGYPYPPVDLNFSMAIYNSSYNLIGYTEFGIVHELNTTGGTYTLNLVSPVELTNGSTYYFAYCANDSSYMLSVSSGSVGYMVYPYGTFPDSFSASGVVSGRDLCMYGNTEYAAITIVENTTIYINPPIYTYIFNITTNIIIGIVGNIYSVVTYIYVNVILYITNIINYISTLGQSIIPPPSGNVFTDYIMGSLPVLLILLIPSIVFASIDRRFVMPMFDIMSIVCFMAGLINLVAVIFIFIASIPIMLEDG
jgi:hypothetical protein